VCACAGADKADDRKYPTLCIENTKKIDLANILSCVRAQVAARLKGAGLTCNVLNEVSQKKKSENDLKGVTDLPFLGFPL